ncbi:flagellar hook-basal body protein [Fusibacter tunisiensis]|uniref:Flagellar basal-body rod protein FlgG n=1 Tax=Fusibacter tunisiensis TaxID=1008308 RepID=A0ABS2MPI0_9FIRM|nr:flagellar hook-basal body protein [Fusibacter tunisiensis]MBM7561308.1 flagellar basal-body rod protein FlgG [Fusibacter tunisiensis]
MIKGLYVAGTNMMANIYKMDVTSNNLANVNTTGFKKETFEVESFNSRLFNRMNGSLLPSEVGVAEVSQSTDGDVYTLNTSKGYFRVNTEDGIHFDKSMKFIVDQDGYLRTPYKNVGGTLDPMQGNLILGHNGAIFVGDGALEISDRGLVSVDGQEVDGLVVQGFPNAIGTMGAGIKGYNVLTNFEQGQLEMTNEKFDVALKGDGFFNIRTENGDYLTRNGAFTVNQYNELVTLDGDYVLGLDGPILIESDNFTINEFGELIQNGEITDKLNITAYSNVGDLYKVGTSHFKVKEDMTGEEMEFEGEVIQGFVERSNTDSITEMIQLIEMNRNYESSQKVVTTIDEMLGKAATELGRV